MSSAVITLSHSGSRCARSLCPALRRECGDFERAIGRAAASRSAPPSHLPDLVLGPARARRLRALRDAVRSARAADALLYSLGSGGHGYGISQGVWDSIEADGEGPPQAALLLELAGRRCSEQAKETLVKIWTVLGSGDKGGAGGKGKKKDGALIFRVWPACGLYSFLRSTVISPFISLPRWAGPRCLLHGIEL